MFLWKFSFVCFATFVVPNLPAHGRKTEKQRNSLITSWASEGDKILEKM
jgi:hypothetical protein